MYDPKPFILEEAIKRDIQIICFLNSLMNKIVYDLQDSPAQTKDLDPKNYGLEILPYYLPSS
jgi:cytosolic carboxypeptidase protein 2/3